LDAKTAKRIDSLYRNINSFLLLTILSIFIPLFLLFAVPLSLAYLYLRAKLLREIDSGRITIDGTDSLETHRPNDLTIQQKVDFIRQNNTRLLLPGIVVIALVLIVVLFILFVD
jgi:hypothetical protein